MAGAPASLVPSRRGAGSSKISACASRRAFGRSSEPLRPRTRIVAKTLPLAEVDRGLGPAVVTTECEFSRGSSSEGVVTKDREYINDLWPMQARAAYCASHRAECIFNPRAGQCRPRRMVSRVHVSRHVSDISVFVVVVVVVVVSRSVLFFFFLFSSFSFRVVARPTHTHTHASQHTQHTLSTAISRPRRTTPLKL